jgi:hypothetical protein
MAGELLARGLTKSSHGGPMARGSKAQYTSKQKRMAKHIEDSEKKSGYSSKRAAEIAWATVNKETGGAGRAIHNNSPSRKGGHNSHIHQSR